MQNGLLFTFEGIRKSFSAQPLLDIDELSLRMGQSIILSGDNGAGKTTLMKIIAGLEKPDQARVTWEQQTVSWSTLRKTLIDRIVYLHQQPYLFNTTVEKNIEYGLRQHAVPAAERRRMVTEGLAWAGLTHLASRNARVLSIGEKQRVALTRAKVLEPRILLLDEPMASMDGAARQQTCGLLQTLRDGGVSIILCSHELDDVLDLGDRHLRLQHGKLIEMTI